MVFSFSSALYLLLLFSWSNICLEQITFSRFGFKIVEPKKNDWRKMLAVNGERMVYPKVWTVIVHRLTIAFVKVPFTVRTFHVRGYLIIEVDSLQWFFGMHVCSLSILTFSYCYSEILYFPFVIGDGGYLDADGQLVVGYGNLWAISNIIQSFYCSQILSGNRMHGIKNKRTYF